MNILIQLLVAAAQAVAAYETANEAEKAQLEAQANAAVTALKGEAQQAKSDHEARTAETIKEIEG